METKRMNFKLQKVTGHPDASVAHYHEAEFLCHRCVLKQKGLVLCIPDVMKLRERIAQCPCIQCGIAPMTFIKMLGNESHVPVNIEGKTFPSGG